MPTVTLRCLITSVAWGLLAKLKAPVPGEVGVRVDRGDLAVTITVHPPGAPEAADRVPGRMLSSTEQLVWQAIQPGEWLVGKEIAGRIGRDYDVRLRYLLLNLEDRGVLAHEDGKGYARAR